MSAKRILFCTDFSRLSDAALPLASSIARERGAALIILHIQEPPTVYAAGELYYGPIKPDEDTLKQMLHRVTPADPAVSCTHQMIIGDPATEIVRVAQEEGVDMIVMSTHGRTGLARVLMGSVAEKVVRRAHCPVVVFKQPDATNK